MYKRTPPSSTKPRKPGSPKFVGPRSQEELEYKEISREMSNEGFGGRWFNKQRPKERKAKNKEYKGRLGSVRSLYGTPPRAFDEMYDEGYRRGRKIPLKGALTYKELVKVLGKLPVEFRNKLRDAYAGGARRAREDARNLPF